MKAFGEAFFVFFVTIVDPFVVEVEGRFADVEHEIERNVQRKNELLSWDDTEGNEAANSRDAIHHPDAPV